MVVHDRSGISVQAGYEALGQAFAAWDGQVESAAALCNALRSLEKLRERPLTDAARAVTVLQRHVVKSPAALVASLDDLAPAHRVMAGVLLGDSKCLPWVGDQHADPPEIARPGEPEGPDIPAVLRVLELAPPTDAIVAWVCEAFHARARRVWVPASRALAALAGRSPALRAQLEAASELAAQGNGWARSLGIDRWLGDDPIRRSHARRHFLHLRMTLAGRGTALHRADAAALLRAELPTGDGADVSVVLLGLAELTRDASIGDDAWVEALERHLATLADTKLLSYQHHDALRELALRLGERPKARALVVRALVEPRLLERHEGRLGNAIDLGIAALDNLRFVLKNSLLPAEALERVVAGYGELEPAGRVALAGPEEPLPPSLGDEVDAVVERLALLRGAVVVTRPPLRLASRVVELVALLERAPLARIPWAALLAEAGLQDTWALAQRGEIVARVARADLAIRLSALGVTEHRALLHEHAPTLSTAEALLVAAVRAGHDSAGAATNGARVAATREDHDGRRYDKFLLDQAAVATARLLDQPPPRAGVGASSPAMEDRVRLLWRLLRADPPDSFWAEVLSTLRWTCRPIHHLVEAIKALDAARPASVPRTTLLRKLRAVADLARELSVESLGRALEGLPDMPLGRLHAGTLATLDRDLDAVRERLDGIDRMLRPRSGGSERSGLLLLVIWLGHDVAELEEASRVVHERLELLIERAEAGRLRSDECDALRDALLRLGAALAPSGLAWPERRLVEAVVDDLKGWLLGCGSPAEAADRGGLSEEVRRREERDADMRRAMAAGDESAVCRLLGLNTAPGDAAELRTGLSAPMLEDAGSFLLGQLLLDEARTLRKGVAAQRTDAEIPAAAAYFAPLWTGILGGGFFTLSLAKTWNDLASAGGSAYWIALLGALGASLGLLMVDLRKRVHRSMAKGGGIWLLVGRRVLPLYATAVAVALGESAALLFIGQGTESTMLAASQGSVELLTADGMYAVALWAAVSLFGGIFLGLIAQGRGAARELTSA